MTRFPAALLVALAIAGPALVAAPQPVAAQEQAVPEAEIAPLVEALGLPELMPIMREEGLAYADELAADMFPGRRGGSWQASVSDIYDTDRMLATMSRELGARLEPEHVDRLEDFFGSELGQRIVGLEISARRALLDPSVEEASEEAYAEMEADGDPRLDLLRGFVEANDLVEMNVVGALNSNWAFYQGLDAGGAFDGQLSEDQMIADVWGQEGAIREDTTEWVYSYLGMAYQPLDDTEIAAYTDLSETPAGRALNAALFAGFDAMFTRISRELGLAAATFMAGEDI